MKKQIKLYRHHTPTFQKIIENSKGYEIDKSLPWNFEGSNKNKAKFYFYGANIKTANYYKTKGSNLYKYKANVNLLDLRKKNDRKLLTSLLNYFLIDENKKRRQMRKQVPLKYQTKILKQVAVLDDIINDKRADSISFWSERSSNGIAGLRLKKDLIRLKKQGIIFNDGLNLEVALIKKAINL
jgi:hypothetical protein